MDDVEYSDEPCPKCGADTYKRRCGCDGGFSHHDCGEDTCCCLHPEPNVVCDECDGKEMHNWCPRCGWDLVQECYINGKPAEPKSQ